MDEHTYYSDQQKQFLSEQHNNYNQSLSYRKEIYNNEIEKVFSSNKFDKIIL